MKYFSPLFLWILLCGAGHAKLFADEIMPPPALLKDPKLLLKWQTQQQQQSESFQQLRQLREQAAERKAEYETAKIEFNAQNTKLLRLSPAQVHAWQTAEVKDDAAYTCILSTPENVNEKVSSNRTPTPPTARRWIALGATFLILLALAIHKYCHSSRARR